MEIIKLSLALGVVFVFSPLIVLGNFTCKDGLRISVSESLNIRGGDIISNSIECLTISSYTLHFYSDAFNELPNLKYLDVQVNNINNNNLFDFGNYTNIVAMKIYRSNRYNNYEIINGFYPNLEYLDLSNNDIEDRQIINGDLFPKLKSLNLSGNYVSLKYLPNILNIRDLDLSRNSLSSFHLPNITNLSLLKLDDNKLEGIGNTYQGINLENLQQLTYLSIANNKIAHISPYAFIDTANLQFLDLSGNPLRSLSSTTFSYLINLETLLLDNTQINEIPPISLNVTTLSMNCNNITAVDNLSHLRYLRKLFFKGNMIDYIAPNLFLTQLEELYLNDNQLDYLPRIFNTSLPNLSYLDLSGNKFSSLESIIQIPGMSITSLVVERNPLRLLESKTFQLIPKNMTIYLNIGSEQPAIRCTTNKYD